jgi:hypothetical protein
MTNATTWVFHITVTTRNEVNVRPHDILSSSKTFVAAYVIGITTTCRDSFTANALSCFITSKKLLEAVSFLWNEKKMPRRYSIDVFIDTVIISLDDWVLPRVVWV